MKLQQWIHESFMIYYLLFLINKQKSAQGMQTPDEREVLVPASALVGLEAHTPVSCSGCGPSFEQRCGCHLMMLSQGLLTLFTPATSLCSYPCHCAWPEDKQKLLTMQRTCGQVDLCCLCTAAPVQSTLGLLQPRLSLLIPLLQTPKQHLLRTR